jgi:hypothetical protein
MAFSTTEYEKIIKNGKKIEWYGVLVPEELITPSISMAAENLSTEIDKLESTLMELRGSDKEKRTAYITAIRNNLCNLPYTLNGDFYLIKKNRVEKEIIELEKTKPKPNKTKKTKSNNLKTKNSNLIFGKK